MKGSIDMYTQNSQTFLDYVKSPTKGVKPFSIPVVIFITIALALFDTVGCVVLVIAGFVFVKMGHKGLGILLALTNCILPDALPLIDEAAGIIIVVIPLYTSWKKAKNDSETVVNAIESQQNEQTNIEISSNDIESSSNIDELNVANDSAKELIHDTPKQMQILQKEKNFKKYMK